MRIIAVALCGWATLTGFAQDSAASRPQDALTLPVAKHAKPFDERDPIVIEVFRATPDTRPVEGEAFARDWRLAFAGRTHRTDADDLALLAADLRALVLPTLSAETESRVSTRALLVRADADAPWACIATVLQFASSAGLLRVFFAVRGAAEGSEHAIACPLPMDRRSLGQRGEPDMRIGIVWRPDPKQPSLGRALVTHGVMVLADDKDLERVYYSDTKEVPVRVEVDGRVPWRRVVDVLDIALRTGKRHIELGPKGALSAAGMIGRGPLQGDSVLDRTHMLGGGRIGRRNSQAGGIQQTEKSVMAGLEWLKRHQNPDGSWDCDGFPATCDRTRGSECTGRGAAAFDIGATGLALLAFLGAGYDSQRQGPYLDTIRNGLKFLKNEQDAEGCFGPRADSRFVYSHACATMAMCEAFASSKLLPWRKSAEQAVSFIEAAQNPLRGWRYGMKSGDDDSSVTGWMIMALQTAKDAGIPVGDGIESGLAFLDSMTDDQTGRTGYMRKGEPPFRTEAAQQKWPSSESEALTALALFTRMHAGRAEGARTRSGSKLLVAKLPTWDEARGSIDMYYWYWGTLAMFQIGGDDWERWDKALKTALIEHQIKDGCAAGSWDPKDPWGEEGGRVYSTALMTLCLEVYYRFPKKR